MNTLLDNEKPIRSPGSDRFCAFILRAGDVAIVSVYRRTKWEIDFDHPVEQYETLSRGATRSARLAIVKAEASA